ncbi:hypothetical protein [Klebsiella quasipneumoniae]|uniref:Ead/Ea22-like family protein n=1 Tax=Klebsiella quasipneumoniae TaxID=1463165 RepID=A0A8H9ZZW0_9ENTR|nr:hypothetical protein [Klebsiella quasipneumoniae]ELC0922909.1 hypothetical protein [Klebsiella quasipneumoniae]MBC5048436.1 hypothetical protein [Klebsiella quasipneumoniae]MDF3328209.1 hypothetical protein [Klebsiella quasipneumoniae subsp. similipneumoniae]TNC64097.1 hypothetical protein FHB93_15170 [Klebsiella quasipneumoniae]
MTDITELAQRMKAAAVRAKTATEEYASGHMSVSVCFAECEEFNRLTDGPDNIIALVEALEKAQQHIAKLESRTVNVKLPTTIEPTAFSPWVAKAFYQFHKDTVKSCFAVFSDACAAAGIKVEAE